MRIPSVSGLGLHVGETRARRGIGNSDKVLAGGALNLSAGVAGVAFQRLITMGAVEFEFGIVHGLRIYDGPKAL